MFLFIVISLGSNSWYTGSDSEEYEFLDGTTNSGTKYTDINYGLSSLDYDVRYTGGYTTDISQNIKYSGSICEDELELNCGKMSTAGTVMQISLWISLLLITSLFVIISARFFGKLNVAFLDENYSEIQFWGWISGSIIPFLGLNTKSCQKPMCLW